MSTHDFTALPYADGEFDVVCYDPPYIPQGGTGYSALDEFRNRFGLLQRNEDGLLGTIMAGASEAARVTHPDGVLCVKAMDFVNGGRFRDWTYRIHAHLIELGMVLHDEVIHNAGSGPGGHNIEAAKRARRCHSKLLVFTWSHR